jgi:hypothetical protein
MRTAVSILETAQSDSAIKSWTTPWAVCSHSNTLYLLATIMSSGDEMGKFDLYILGQLN